VKDLSGRTAVVTGAASGIGLALATRFAAEGMNVVMSDIEQGRLDEAAKTIAAKPGQLLAVPTDVGKVESVQALAAAALDAFGKVHVLCANAGVASYGSVWEQSLDDWKWTIDVNLWGVIHCLRAFIPGMLAHGEEGHLVTTSSAAGLMTSTSSAYGATKYAVLGISEGLAIELAETPIGVTVLCPGGVRTKIFESERNRPQDLRERGVFSEKVAQWVTALKDPNRTDQVPPSYMAELVVQAIRLRQLYIMPTQLAHRKPIRERLQRMLAALDSAATSG